MNQETYTTAADIIAIMDGAGFKIAAADLDFQEYLLGLPHPILLRLHRTWQIHTNNRSVA